MNLLQPIAVLDDLRIRGQPANQPWAEGSQCGRSINNCQSESLSQVYCTSYLREVIDHLVGALQSQLALLLEAASGVDSDGQVLAVVLSLGEILNIFKVTKRPREQVCRHDRCAIKADDLVSSLLALLRLFLRHVRQGSKILGNLHLKVESGLQVGLVEARESAAGVGRLELGGEHVVVLVVFGDTLGSLDGGRVLRTVEASHGVVHGALEGDCQDGLVGLRKLLVESEGAALVLLIVADVGSLDGGRSLAGIVGDLSRVDLELVGVECDGLGGLLDGEVDRYTTLVGPWCVWLEVEEGDVVVGRLDTGNICLAMVLLGWYGL